MGRALVIGDDETVLGALQVNCALGLHEIHHCTGDVEALQLVRERAFDVVLTDPETSIPQDLALAHELSRARPGLRIIALAPAATQEDLISALRAHVFACFTAPFNPPDILDMVCSALKVVEWRDGIEVVSGVPHWFTVRVSSHLVSADRLVRFMTEHLTEVTGDERDLFIAAFREILLNAMEHGAGFDEEKVIEVTAARTARALVYHIRDPGTGFDRRRLPHAATTSDAERVVAAALRRSELGLRPGGLGMLIAQQVADELVYNEHGNEVLLVKHLDTRGHDTGGQVLK